MAQENDKSEFNPLKELIKKQSDELRGEGK